MPTHSNPKSPVAVSTLMFWASQKKKTSIAKMSQPFKKESNFQEGRVQTSNQYPGVEIVNLKKSAGEEVWVDLVGYISGEPNKGSENIEGTGEKPPWSRDSIKINATTKAIDCGSLMEQQNTSHSLRKVGVTQAVNYAERYVEQAAMIQCYGSRGFDTNAQWVIPFESSPRFNVIMDNPVLPTTRNRAYMSDGGAGLQKITATANELDIATTDVLTLSVLEAINVENEESPYPVQGCKFDGDDMGADFPVNVLWVSPRQYKNLRDSTSFKEFQSQALARAGKPGQHPIFTGRIGMMDNTIVLKQPQLIRFYAGDEVKYSSSLTAKTVTTGDLVPAAFGTTHAVERALFVGASAFGKAYGGFGAEKFKEIKRLAGFMYNEKWLNAGMSLEVYIMMLLSIKKFRFDLDFGGAGNVQPTDQGIITIDTAVAL